MSANWLSVFLLGSISLLVAAQAEAASFKGELRSQTDHYTHSIGEPTDDLVPYLTLDLNGKHKFTKSFRTQWKVFALTNFEADDQPEKFYGDLPEAFLEYKLSGSGTRWRAGMNTFNWGVVDVSSPSDVVNPLAVFHPMRTMKRGSPMVEMLWDSETVGLDLIYIPKQQRPLMPSPDSRWLPRDFLITPEYTVDRIIVPKGLEYTYDSPETLDHALDHNYGAKLFAHLNSWELQLTHFEGVAPSVKARPRAEFTLGSTASELVARSPIHLTPVAYRTRTTGAGAVWAGEELIVRAESAYQHSISEDDLLQDWIWTNVAAVETSVDVGTRTLTLLGQFYYSQNPQKSDNFISSSYRLFDRTGLLGARLAWSEELTFTGSALYDTIDRGLFWMVGFDNKLSNNTKWGLAWRDFSAQQQGLIKTFEKNDHATLDLIYYF